MNINMRINIEDDCQHALPAGALPPNPHAFGATGFFYTGPDAILILNPPGLKLSPRCATSSRALNPQALLEQGSSPVKRSSSRARVPQGLLKPSSRRVKDSLKKPSPIQECASIHTVDWSSTTHTSVNSCPVTGTNRFSRHASRYSSRYVWHASTTSRRIHRMRY